MDRSGGSADTTVLRAVESPASPASMRVQFTQTIRLDTHRIRWDSNPRHVLPRSVLGLSHERVTDLPTELLILVWVRLYASPERCQRF